MTREEWRPVGGWPSYEVSEFGRVRREGRVLTPSRARGYLRIFMNAPGAWPRYVYVHRLVATAFHGPQPSPEHEVAHADGTRDNNCADNLRWARPFENAADRLRHGTVLRGEKQPRSKLRDDDVRAIRTSVEDLAVLAARYRVCPTTIWMARHRLTWKHVA